MIKPLINVQAAANFLNMSKDQVYHLTRQNILPCVRMGRQIRFSPDILQEFIQSGGKAFEGGWKKCK
jgi:excisionase family DNA binding protein